jgi:hypothetical protein
MSRFTQRHLDPASRAGEILFGLIMVLAATLTAGLKVSEGKAGVRQLLLTAIGVNVAWGIIDAVMYIMNSMIVRRGKIRLVRAVQRSPNIEAALSLIQDEIEPELQDLLDPQTAEAFGKSVHQSIVGARITEKILTKDDLLGAVASFWLVFVSCLPAALPFLIFSQPAFALRISNLLLIGMLFYVGQKWAHFAGRNRFLIGSAMVAVGLALVGVTILLGG